MKSVYNKWFHDTRVSVNTNANKALRSKFSVNYVWKVWDGIRGLTCAVCGSNTVAGIKDTEKALDFCEKLCEFIDYYMNERSRQ